MSLYIDVLLLCLWLCCVIRYVQADVCTLTGFPSKDPYPSLVTCYKYNNEACCLSVHDDYIKDQLSAMLTDSCLGKYTELEDLMCLGCHPFEMAYFTEDEEGNRVLKLCKDFAKRLWDASSDEDLDSPTYKYDNCGFKSGYFYSDAEKPFIMPSRNFTNVSHFLHQLVIPFYDGVSVVITEDDGEGCYNWKWKLKVNVGVVMVVVGLLLGG